MVHTYSYFRLTFFSVYMEKIHKDHYEVVLAHGVESPSVAVALDTAGFADIGKWAIGTTFVCPTRYMPKGSQCFLRL
jgi:hypothetical protein